LRVWGDLRGEKKGHAAREIRDNALGVGPGKIPLLPYIIYINLCFQYIHIDFYTIIFYIIKNNSIKIYNFFLSKKKRIYVYNVIYIYIYIV